MEPAFIVHYFPPSIAVSSTSADSTEEVRPEFARSANLEIYCKLQEENYFVGSVRHSTASVSLV